LNETFLLSAGQILAAALEALTCGPLVLCEGDGVGMGVDVVAVGSVFSGGFESVRKWAARENDSSAWRRWNGGRCTTFDLVA
jgi:hypothetical protein